MKRFFLIIVAILSFYNLSAKTFRQYKRFHRLYEMRVILYPHIKKCVNCSFLDWSCWCRKILKYELRPTFTYVKSEKSFLENLFVDKNILYEQIFIIDRGPFWQTWESWGFNFYNYTFRENDTMYMEDYFDDAWNLVSMHSEEEFFKMRTAYYDFMDNVKYDFAFRVDKFPDYWFYLKDDKLGMYSIKNGILITEDEKIQKIIDSVDTE